MLSSSVFKSFQNNQQSSRYIFKRNLTISNGVILESNKLQLFEKLFNYHSEVRAFAFFDLEFYSQLLHYQYSFDEVETTQLLPFFFLLYILIKEYLMQFVSWFHLLPCLWNINIRWILLESIFYNSHYSMLKDTSAL